jgi:hypothetical protein
MDPDKRVSNLAINPRLETELLVDVGSDVDSDSDTLISSIEQSTVANSHADKHVVPPLKTKSCSNLPQNSPEPPMARRSTYPKCNSCELMMKHASKIDDMHDQIQKIFTDVIQLRRIESNSPRSKTYGDTKAIVTNTRHVLQEITDMKRDQEKYRQKMDEKYNTLENMIYSIATQLANLHTECMDREK